MNIKDISELTGSNLIKYMMDNPMVEISHHIFENRRFNNKKLIFEQYDSHSYEWTTCGLTFMQYNGWSIVLQHNLTEKDYAYLEMAYGAGIRYVSNFPETSRVLLSKHGYAHATMGWEPALPNMLKGLRFGVWEIKQFLDKCQLEG